MWPRGELQRPDRSQWIALVPSTSGHCHLARTGPFPDVHGSASPRRLGEPKSIGRSQSRPDECRRAEIEGHVYLTEEHTRPVAASPQSP